MNLRNLDNLKQNIIREKLIIEAKLLVLKVFTRGFTQWHLKDKSSYQTFCHVVCSDDIISNFDNKFELEKEIYFRTKVYDLTVLILKEMGIDASIKKEDNEFFIFADIPVSMLDDLEKFNLPSTDDVLNFTKTNTFKKDVF